MTRYSVLLLPDAEFGGYTVEVPMLPGVVTEGRTRDEALGNVREAIELFLDDLLADGEELPDSPEQPELVSVMVDAPGERWAELADEINGLSSVWSVLATVDRATRPTLIKPIGGGRYMLHRVEPSGEDAAASIDALGEVARSIQDELVGSAS